MSVKSTMYEITEEEISRIEEMGEKVKLRTVSAKRKKATKTYGIIFLILNVLFFITGREEQSFIAFSGIVLVVYFIKMFFITNASVIYKLAQENPDKPIDQIIREDMEI